MSDIKNLKGPVFYILSFFIIILPLLSSFYKYFYTKNYDYLIEANCDPSVEICYYRDCLNTDECPPNGLSTYKKFYVKAYDFDKCSDDTCSAECASGLIKCIPIICGKLENEICTNHTK
jgi:hypothetical protein